MTFDTTAPEIAFALRTVRKAAQLARRIRASMPAESVTKDDLSPVTVADFALQALVARDLEETFPGDPLVAEERAADLRSSPAVLETVTGFVRETVDGVDGVDVCRWIDRGGAEVGGRFWTLDPIDGTKGYLRGGQYAVALALVVGGEVKLGVLGCPNLEGGVLAAAVRGQGAWRMPLDEDPAKAGTTNKGDSGFVPLHVSECEDPARARMLRSFEAAHTNTEQIDALAHAMNIQAEPVLMDSQAKYIVLAGGGAELLVRLLSPKNPGYREKIWDHAAGSIIVEEAGGRITDLDGVALDFTQGRALNKNRGLLVSNGRLHELALVALSRLA